MVHPPETLAFIRVLSLWTGSFRACTNTNNSDIVKSCAPMSIRVGNLCPSTIWWPLWPGQSALTGGPGYGIFRPPEILSHLLLRSMLLDGGPSGLLSIGWKGGSHTTPPWCSLTGMDIIILDDPTLYI